MTIHSINGYYSQFTLPITYIPDDIQVPDHFFSFNKPPFAGLGMGNFQALQNTCNYLQKFFNQTFSEPELIIDEGSKSLQIKVLTKTTEKSEELNQFFKYLDENKLLIDLMMNYNGDSDAFNNALEKIYETYKLNQELNNTLSQNIESNSKKVKL
jgi:hypothetical protein